MLSDYTLIRAENVRKYGTDIGRIGPMLLAERYDDRSHFIFELLQNAEDALARRSGWHGSRAVSFTLSDGALRISHFGLPFSQADVRGICGIAEGAKDLTAIGRFGIGFKSVYAFTDRPEVHSAGENFGIESYVWPTPAPTIDRHIDETVFILPLRKSDAKACDEITPGLQRLGPRTLLFLREIEEISWSADDGPSGLYLRSKPENMGQDARKVVLLGEEVGKKIIEETWLVFSREVCTNDGISAGFVEIAFALGNRDDMNHETIKRVDDSRLVVFFPTISPTNLGFLLQGPYRTTPSRDNVPSREPWNQHLVRETALLLVQALHALRDKGMLDADALRSLPLDRNKFGEASMFAPLFEATRSALSSEPLLPCYAGGYAPASQLKLARTQELREFFSPRQLTNLFGDDEDLSWLSGDITHDRTPELRQYLLYELGVPEITPEAILSRLDKAFLEAQPDEWIVRLYEFMNGQPALLRQLRLVGVPLVRLENGTHVNAQENDQPQAFLPSEIVTDFPTVRRTICVAEGARKFLRSLGLTEPEPVDDVIRNVLTKYCEAEFEAGGEEYEADIRRLLIASRTDSKAQRDKLVSALRETTFVRVVDAGSGLKRLAKPGDVYLSTERLKELFAGVSNILLVDDSLSCLKGEDVRELLEACGAARYLQAIPAKPRFDWEQRRDMRRAAGCESMSSEGKIDDYALRGLDQVLAMLPTLDPQARAIKARLLWEALKDVEDRRGTGAFSGTYRWFYYCSHSASFDAAFVQQLNNTTWIPNANGELQKPEFVAFETLDWEANPFLLSKIRFRPPVIEILAKEAGIEPGVLDLLKKAGITSVAELQSRLGISEESEAEVAAVPNAVKDALQKMLGFTPGPTPPVQDPSGAEPPRSGGGKHALGRSGGWSFISYIAVHPSEEDPDPDTLDCRSRIELEDKAIRFIITKEPCLHRAPPLNPGFDLFETDPNGQPVRWVEVKAMTSGLHDRAVGLSRTQFECAQAHGKAYWLYVVEHAGDASSARIVRIQDPAGNARTFTFDRGWLAIAKVNNPIAENSEKDREEQ